MSITVTVEDGPNPITVAFKAGMNAQTAIELAQQQKPQDFIYALTYYGANLGYLVSMINETYDSFLSSAAPFYYWEFLLNGQPSPTGIDTTQLNDGDAITFSFTVYNASAHAKTPLAAKHQMRTGQSSRR
jgi:Domain of unknown function (DUF4430)